MKVKAHLEKLFDGILGGLTFFSGCLLVLVMLGISVDVVMRYFLNRPIIWVGELSEYALLYITFTATAWVLKNDMHVKVDILIAILHPKHHNKFGFVASLIGIFVCAILTYYGVKVSWDHFVRHVYEPTLMEFPKAPLLMIIPIGTFLLLIQFIRRIFAILAEYRSR